MGGGGLMKSSDLFVIDLFYRDGPIASLGGGPSEVHIRIPYGNLFQGVCVGKLVLLLLYTCDFPRGAGG